MGGPGWRVTTARSVMGVLLVTVETDRVDDAVRIARDVVEPTKSEHLEALVYFHRPDAPLAAARVQWTPRRGYITTALSY